MLAAEKVKPNRTSRFEVSRRRKAQTVICGGQPAVSGFVTGFSCMAPQETHGTNVKLATVSLMQAKESDASLLCWLSKILHAADEATHL